MGPWAGLLTALTLVFSSVDWESELYLPHRAALTVTGNNALKCLENCPPCSQHLINRRNLKRRDRLEDLAKSRKSVWFLRYRRFLVMNQLSKTAHRPSRKRNEEAWDFQTKWKEPCPLMLSLQICEPSSPIDRMGAAQASPSGFCLERPVALK